MDINATILGQAIAFAGLIWFSYALIWPPLLNAIEERRQRISEGLAAAERGKRELEEADEQVAELVREAREEAKGILDQANRRSVELVDEAKVKAREEGERLVAAARAEIERETAQARETLRAEVAGIAVAGASRILGEEIDASAHAALLDDLAGQLRN